MGKRIVIKTSVGIVILVSVFLAALGLIVQKTNAVAREWDKVNVAHAELPQE